MKKAIIGKKVGMTQIFDETGKVVPVTVIEAGPCKVVQKKSAEKEGYASVQLGFEEIPERKLNKPEKGHLDKAGVGALRVLHEFRLENANEMNVGDVVKADAFKEGEGRRHRHQQGQGLRRRHQALGRPAHPDDPRRRPGPPSCRLHGLLHGSQPHPSRQDRRRSHGRRAGHGAEP